MKWREAAPSAAEDKPDLEAVLAAYGVDMRGRQTGMTQCPLHSDTTPSCSVDLNKQLWNCHSCGEAGDSYKLIMLKEDCDYRRARALGAEYGVAARSAGGGRDGLPAGRFQRGGTVPARQGDRQGGGGYVPSWRGR